MFLWSPCGILSGSQGTIRVFSPFVFHFCMSVSCSIYLFRYPDCRRQKGIFETTTHGSALKLVEKFTYLGSNVSSNETDIDTRLAKVWTAIDRLLVVWKSDLTDKMKRSFLLAAVVSILLYVCTTWMLTKRMEKKLNSNYTRMLRAILNKSWWQHHTKQQLSGHLPPVTKTIKIRRNRHVGHCWRSMDELVSDVLRWAPSQGRAKAGRPARTYMQQLCADTGCSPEDQPKAMDDREGGDRGSARHDDDTSILSLLSLLLLH